MATRLSSIASPGAGVYRLTRRRTPIFSPPPWRLASSDDGTFKNRFDDPGKIDEIDAEDRFRMIYCATDRMCALMESTARFRRSVRTITQFEDVTSDAEESPQESASGTYDPQDPTRGLVPAAWRSQRKAGHVHLDPSLRFVDIAASSSMSHLRRALAEVVVELGFDDIDLSAVTGPHRKLTQRTARYVYEQVDRDGRPRFAVIRYLSRLGNNQECWAIFDTRLVTRGAVIELDILPDDADLMAVARMFGLTIEVLDSQCLRP